LAAMRGIRECPIKKLKGLFPNEEC
jgi:hypothetical protein